MNQHDDMLRALSILIDNNRLVNSRLALLNAELQEPGLTIEELRESCISIVITLAKSNAQSALNVGGLLEKYV